MKRKAGGQGSKKAGGSKTRGAKSFVKKGERAGVGKKAAGRGYNSQAGDFSLQRKSRMSREAKERAAIKRRDARAEKYEADGMSPEAAMARAQKELWKD